MLKRLRAYLERRRQTRRIRETFGHYISPALVEKMIATGETTEPAAREVELTAIFANLENYVGIAEQTPLAQLPELMNAYFTACTDALDAQGATLDKFVGDCVVAMCGAPQPLPDHALRACLAALRIQESIATLRGALAAEGAARWPACAQHLRVRIGLHTGVVLVGLLGPPGRFSFTMMGDNVNLAARLEQGAKHYGARIVCTQDTQVAAELHAPGRVLFRPLGAIVIKGRAHRVELFEPMALRGQAAPELTECLRLFSCGFERFRAADWAGAIPLFEASACLERDQPGLMPGVALNPSLTFLRLAREYHVSPPGPLAVT